MGMVKQVDYYRRSRLLVVGRIAALMPHQAELAELSNRCLEAAATRTSTTCSHPPIAHPPPPNSPTHSTHSHNAFHSCSPRCVRLTPPKTTRCARPTTTAVTSKSPRIQPLTSNVACPTSRVFTARTTSLRGRDSTRTTTVLGSGRRWVYIYSCAGEESWKRRDWHTARANRTQHQEQHADERTTGPSRQDHALPLLRHFGRYQCRYVLQSATSSSLQRTDNPTATMYMMCRMVLGHKTWY
jgi:hypothetical protein